MKSLRIVHDFSQSLLPLHLASSSQLSQGISDLKILCFLLEGSSELILLSEALSGRCLQGFKVFTLPLVFCLDSGWSPGIPLD